MNCKRIVLMLGLLPAMALAAPTTYTLDPDHTVPRFEILHNSFSYQIGGFTKTAGKATLDPEAGTGSVEVTVQMDSFATGQPTMERIVKGKDFLNVEQTPTMQFRSDRVNFANGKPVSVDGQLTMMGVTKPLTLGFVHFVCGQHPFNKKNQCGGNLTGTLRRSDYGVSLLIPAIADEMKLMIQVEAFKD